MSVPIDVAGRIVEISGELDDPYFGAADAHAAAMSHLDAALGRIPEDAVIFDVGANIGLSALHMAIRKPQARIFAFEAGPTTAKHLKTNTAAFGNIVTVAAAVSDKAGTIHFYQSTNASGAHVVGPGHAGHAGHVATVPVPCLRLDDFASEHGLAPALLKIDVEGHEPEVIAGAGKLIAEAKPVLHMEFNSWTLMAFGGHSPASFIKALFGAFDIDDASDALTTLHNNLLRDGCVSDLTMRLKEGVVVPSLVEMSYPLAAQAEIAALKKGSSEKKPRKFRFFAI